MRQGTREILGRVIEADSRRRFYQPDRYAPTNNLKKVYAWYDRRLPLLRYQVVVRYQVRLNYRAHGLNPGHLKKGDLH
jgi:hypothetical protein